MNREYRQTKPERKNISFQANNRSAFSQCINIFISLAFLFCLCPVQNVKAQANMTAFSPQPSTTLPGVNLLPESQNKLASLGKAVIFQETIKNTGSLGTDTFDLLISSAWSATFYQADGVTPLMDTDNDSIIDSGPISQGSSESIWISLQTPPNAVMGESDQAILTARSSRDASLEKTITLQASIPAPFAQANIDPVNGSMSLILVQPAFQVNRTISDTFHANGSNPVVKETSSGDFIYIWENSFCLNSACTLHGSEINWRLLNAYGEPLTPIQTLMDNRHAVKETFDRLPAVAVTPDGCIGILWLHDIHETVDGKEVANTNLYMAILDASGQFLYDPVNLTNDSAWSALNTWNIYFKLAATDDNHFVLVAQTEGVFPDCTVNNCLRQDIEYAILSERGEILTGFTFLTHDVPNNVQEEYNYPAVTSLTNHQVLITWNRNSDNDIYALRLSSQGEIVAPVTDISNDGNKVKKFTQATTQLSDGRVFVAYWSSFGNVYFIILDASNQVVAGPTPLNNLAGSNIATQLSVSSAPNGRAILTWIDYDNHRLIYALVDSSGQVISQPSFLGNSNNLTSDDTIFAYGIGSNTAYTSSFANQVDTAFLPAQTTLTTYAGRSVPVTLQYANHGLATATGVVLKATLSPGEIYTGDTSGITPTIQGNQVTWNLPDLTALEERQFTLSISLPAKTVFGSHPNITFTLAAQDESNVADNTLQVNLQVTYPAYLPFIAR